MIAFPPEIRDWLIEELAAEKDACTDRAVRWAFREDKSDDQIRTQVKFAHRWKNIVSLIGTYTIRGLMRGELIMLYQFIERRHSTYAALSLASHIKLTENLGLFLKELERNAE